MKSYSDRGLLQGMFDKQNIEYEVKESKDGGKEVWVERGYMGFYTIFTFNVDDDLKDIGAYE